MGHEAAPSPVGRVFAAVGLALTGTVLAVFAFPLMRQSDALRRDGLRAAATVVAVEDATCSYSNRRTSREYPCFKATGEWTHDGLAYRAIVGHFERRDEVSVGTTLAVVFAPDPAAAAGKADLRFRVVGAGRTEPRSERPFYLALLALAGLMWIPLVTMLFQRRIGRSA